MKSDRVLGHLAGINMNSVHFTMSPNMSSHSGGMPTVGYWGKMLLHYVICSFAIHHQYVND